MTAYSDLLVRLPAIPKTWLITGVAGFIGCNLLVLVAAAPRFPH